MLLFCIGILFYSLFGLRGKEYYFISLAIILSGIIMFLFRFESRKPSVAELTILAVMCSIAIVSRIAFYTFPQIKPMTAVIIITGISLGAESGFIIGALTAFVSNFYFGQGSWTPFQMFALGTVGFFAGLVFKKIPAGKISISIYGLLSTVILYGGIVDINTVFLWAGENTWNSILAVYGAGLGFNLLHGICTAVFLVLLERPILNQLTRIKIKYGLIDAKM